MSVSFFCGAYGDEGAAFPADARLECKICWHVYDPAEGDEVRQIPAGTPFAALPAQWSCPNCDGGKDGFLVVPDQ